MSVNHRLGFLALAIWMGLFAPWGAVWGQAPATDASAAPRFEIARFEINGNTLLGAEEIERIFAPYTGQNKDFGDIQRALESLEQAYRDRGFAAVQVLLPEQDITRGVVRLNVIEPRLGKIIVEGNQHFDEANIRSSLPGLQPGVTPNSGQIARNLQLLNEHPAKQTTVLLRAGASEDEIDATVKVTDEKPLRYAVTLDNTGTAATGRYRAGFGLQHSNLTNRDDILNLQYVTSPDHLSKVTIFGAGYRIPFYAHNSSLELFAGYSDVNSGTLQGLFNVSGSGTILGARYNLYLNKIGAYEHKLSFGLDYRAYTNDVTLVGIAGGLVPDVTVHPVSVTYTGLSRTADSEYGFYASYSRNLPGGNDGTDIEFRAARAGAIAGYSILRGGANFTRVFPGEWQFRAVINGQYTGDALVPGEQFGFGGPDSVRGFNVREVANDKGYSGSVEFYTPDFGSKLGSKLGWNDVKVRALAFYDQGTTYRNKIQPGESSGQSGASVGVGLRLSYAKRLSLRLDFAQVVDPAGNQGRNDQMLHAGVVVLF
jgi:hemolysin activation/secretion protein